MKHAVARFLAGIGLLVAAQPVHTQPVYGTQSAADIHAHMAFLASDLLHGRDTGSADYDIAARYVAAQMEQLGLMPMGDGGAATFNN